MALFSFGRKSSETDIDSYNELIKHQLEGMGTPNPTQETTEKGYKGKPISLDEPVTGVTLSGINPGYRDKPYFNGVSSINATLKTYSNNVILNAIIATRAGQVLTFANPASESEQGTGFTIGFDDMDRKPNAREKELFKKMEHQLMQMGTYPSNNRLDLHQFIKVFVHDTYVYDQVNFENIYKNNEWVYTKMVDPSTIFFRADEKARLVTQGKRYVQVIENQVRRQFDDKELAMVIRNPQSDIYSSGYGLSELMICIREFMAHENTEIFNDRFFSHGGTTRGILNIKQSGDGNQPQARQAMDDFKRMWNVSLQGINGSWQLPVVSAPDDIQYINLTPQARDMEFEKWLNYLINVISSVFGIDSAEIGFPNKGGATGNKSHSLNEGNQGEQMQNSRNRGLRPLMITIEDAINRYIVKPNFGSEYKFRFMGGDPTAELAELDKITKQLSTYKTVREVRRAKKLRGRIDGDDVVLNQYAIQRSAQKTQERQLEHAFAMDAINLLQQMATPKPIPSSKPDTPKDTPDKDIDSNVNFQDVQHGFDGKTKPSDRMGSTQDGKVREPAKKAKKTTRAKKTITKKSTSTKKDTLNS